MSPAGEAVVGLLVALGAVVVLPLGLRLLGPQVVPAPRSAAWPLAGAAAVASLLLPHSRLAVVLTLPFVLASAVLLGAGVRLAVRTLRPGTGRSLRPRARAVAPGGRGEIPGEVPPRVDLAARVATVTALVLPAVGASALVAERAEWGLLGFSGTYLALTVPHMLYAGFGAALVAGAVARLAPDDRLATAGAWGVPAGTALVLAGYFVGDVAELVGAVVLTLALWATAAAVARSLARPGGRPAAARVLLGTAAVVVSASMVLALWWAGGEALGFAHPSLDVMAATHGVGNALGFVLCALLGVRLLARDGTTPAPAGDSDPTSPRPGAERSTA
ncbi:YndJ family transporter [Cellulosimicrobium sp. 4261]|uniref:YndJ family transporter n=1 Tax=Cellulosimicrobium sp. 4261 TaxID=3156458 RepID=UPI00339245E6